MPEHWQMISRTDGGSLEGWLYEGQLKIEEAARWSRLTFPRTRTL